MSVGLGNVDLVINDELFNGIPASAPSFISFLFNIEAGTWHLDSEG